MQGEIPKRRKDMNIHLDRPRRVRATLMFWLFLIAVAGLLALLLMRFTGSKLVAFGMAGGMLLYMLMYMLIAGLAASRHLTRNSRENRFD
jgi:hypothetical protein